MAKRQKGVSYPGSGKYFGFSKTKFRVNRSQILVIYERYLNGFICGQGGGIIDIESFSFYFTHGILKRAAGELTATILACTTRGLDLTCGLT